MAKKTVTRIAKINLIGGQAKPGPALASVGINMGEFTKQFNEKTKDRQGETIPCIITAFNDKSFTFVLKTTPVSNLIKQAAKLEKGAKNAKTIVGKISLQQAKKIAQYKLVDLNANTVEAALKMVLGTAKQMGIEVTD
ncbi:50S ribosomal protein L11 [Mycoplasmoides genitalium]